MSADSDREVLVDFDAALYSADAIQRAAYRMLDRCALDLRRAGDLLIARLIAIEGADWDEREVAADFRNEVTDEVLRERIRDETSAVRNLVLALAFSETGLSGEHDGS